MYPPKHYKHPRCSKRPKQPECSEEPKCSEYPKNLKNPKHAKCLKNPECSELLKNPEYPKHPSLYMNPCLRCSKCPKHLKRPKHPKCPMCPKHPKKAEHPKCPRAPSPKQGTGSPARCPAPAEEAACPKPLPVTRQRWDIGRAERSRVLPVGHQLHHLSLDGQLWALHGRRRTPRGVARCGVRLRVGDADPGRGIFVSKAALGAIGMGPPRVPCELSASCSTFPPSTSVWDGAGSSGTPV